MKGELLRIGEMARINRTTVSTLRLYDRLGLLRPFCTDRETGYRYYDIRQNARLDMIRYMKELGMRLDEIKDVFVKEDITLIEEILIRKKEQIFEQIRQLGLQQDAVALAIQAIERYRKSPTNGVTSLEYIDRRIAFAIPVRVNFYNYDISAYEQVLSDLKRALSENDVPQLHQRNVGTSIRCEDFLQGRFIASEIFVFVNSGLDGRASYLRELDSGMYACIYLDRYDDEIEYARRLLDFCRKEKYRICGDYVCEVLTEFNIFDSRERAMFLRLQVPVRFERA